MKDILKSKQFIKFLPVYIVIIAMILILGTSYSLLRSSQISENPYTINVGTLQVDFFGTTNSLSISDMAPLSDEDGLDQSQELTFTVKNTGNLKAEYDVYIEETSTSPEFKSVIRYAVNKNNEGYGDVLSLTNNMLYIDKDQVLDVNPSNPELNESATYKVKIWLSDTADNTYMNKTFTAKIVVVSRQAPSGITASQLITNIKANNLVTQNNTPINYVTETNNGDTITYLSGCSKYYLDQDAEGCTEDNTIDFNYVWYSGRMWRITSFNETTNTIKLITEEPQTAIAWHDSSSAFEGSYVKQFLNDEFYDTLYNPTNFIDTSVKWDITTTTSVSTKLSNPTVTSNVGLLNTYEYYNSYQKVDSTNKYDYGYLNIGQFWWLLTPYSPSYVCNVFSNGYAEINSPTYTDASRPSINLLSDVSFIGSGTESDPYRMVGDMNIGATNDYLKDRQVGEYVKLKNGANEQVFRIVSFENNTTKLVALDYADSGNTKKFATANSSGNGTIFGEGNTLGSSSDQTWYYYLADPNNSSSYINDLKTKYDTGATSMFTTGNYYLGINANNPSDNTVYYNYRTSICASASDLTKNCVKTSTNSPKSLEAGLLRYGEMFAAQHGIGYDTKTSTYNTRTMWLMTRRTASSVWYVVGSGSATYDNGPLYAIASRPSINLSSGVKIVTCDATLCDGTPSHPYVVGL